MEERLRFINRVNVAAFFVVLLLTLPFTSLAISIGAALGAGIIALNFIALQAIFSRMLAGDGKIKGAFLGLYVLKFIVLLLAVGLILFYLPVNKLAFVCGTLILLVSLSALALKSVFQGS